MTPDNTTNNNKRDQAERTSALLVLFVSSCLATYGHHGHNDGYGKGSGSSKDIHLDSSTIHLDSPKIVVDRPRFHIKDDDSGHGHIAVHSTPKAVAPIIINGGHGGYGSHGGYEGHGGKVLNVAGMINAVLPFIIFIAQ
ncbi:hypothetical protein JTE90_002068 [Oedothorax gibbosus]|uniref:Uncharacterized protein n=1 Tax=Oedothorax gibbosus TaxID=931172 RepID=A0AAV6UEV8_9ARAC|nr:hypothetical protein JTE90_002068 [Oedothorax gibbosus]